uniref:Uncharacterized protein n=1 Tax=Arundo donax TaxID=35708 RepID=A0A0A8XV59_ARUDO
MHGCFPAGPRFGAFTSCCHWLNPMGSLKKSIV